MNSFLEKDLHQKTLIKAAEKRLLLVDKGENLI